MSQSSESSSFEETILAAFRGASFGDEEECPDAATLTALAEQKLSAGRSEELMEHIAFCSNCRQQYAAILDIWELESLAKPVRKPPFLWIAGAAVLSASIAAALVFATVVAPLGRDRSQRTALIEDLQRRLTQSGDSTSQIQATQRELEELKKKNDRLSLEIGQTQNLVASLSKSEQTLEQIPLPSPTWNASTSEGSNRGGGDTPHHGADIELLSPVGEAILSSKPILTIKPVSGASHYQVSLQDAETSKDLDAPSSISSTEWKPAHPLTQGRAYKWAVTCERNGSILSSTYKQFYVVGPADRERIAKSQKLGDPLALAATYASIGLDRLAKSELTKALTQNPKSQVAQNWLLDLRRREARSQ